MLYAAVHTSIQTARNSPSSTRSLVVRDDAGMTIASRSWPPGAASTDVALAALGYRRTGDWSEPAPGDWSGYRTAPVEPIAEEPS